VPGIQVYFSRDELDELEKAAQQRGEPLNRVIREAVRLSLQGKPEIFHVKTRALEGVNLAMLGILWVTGLMVAGWGLI
jgi:hypothetical protein